MEDTATIKISGMSCHHCAAAVKKALSGLPGVTVKEVTVGAASVGFDPARTSLESIRRAIADAGYEPVS